MSGGESRNLSPQDLLLVKSRIEHCLQHYMHKNDVINALAINENIDPNLTELIWQQLEEENAEFFKAYYLKLLVKDQIMEFNRLLSEQIDLMHRIGGVGWITPIFTSNESHVSPLQDIPTLSSARDSRILTTESMHQQQQTNVFVDCASSIHPATAQVTVDGSSFFPDNMGLAQATSNGNIIPRTEANYADGSHFDFSPSPGDLLEARALLVADAGESSFSGADTTNMQHHHHLSDALLDSDGSSFGFLTQSLSFPELPADFPDTSDILGSSFITPEAENLVNPNEDIERLNPESGNLRYQSFGGD